jgi:hypothetical protein
MQVVLVYFCTWAKGHGVFCFVNRVEIVERRKKSSDVVKYSWVAPNITGT